MQAQFSHRRARGFLAASSLIAGLAAAQTALALDSSGVRAVPTYESVGLYWSNASANSDGCNVQYRKQGESSWHPALNLWFDSSKGECRGSIVMLQPGTQYETVHDGAGISGVVGPGAIYCLVGTTSGDPLAVADLRALRAEARKLAPIAAAESCGAQPAAGGAPPAGGGSRGI